MRQVYAVRGGSAKELTTTLSLHFKSERDFQAVPESNSNMILLSGPKAALEDALAVLREIDRPARTVHVEVFLVELAAKAGGDAKAPDVGDLSGPARDVRAKMRELQQKGAITNIKTMELSALTGHYAVVSLGASKPYQTSVTSLGGGGTSNSYAYRSVGTMVAVQPEVSPDGVVTLDLHVSDGGMKMPENGISVGTNDKGTAIIAPQFATFSLESRVKVWPGQVVVAQGAKAASKAGEARTIVLVSASLDETASKGGK